MSAHAFRAAQANTIILREKKRQRVGGCPLEATRSLHVLQHPPASVSGDIMTEREKESRERGERGEKAGDTG